MAPLKVRFERMVAKSDGCWEWTGYRCKKGYGRIAFDGPRGKTFITAHRASWLIHVGAVAEGILVCHRCDNPPCTNPGHLFLGTPRDNSADMVAKGRSMKGRRYRSPKLWGENGPMAKLTEANVKEIKRLFDTDMTNPAIGARYGVSGATVWDIRQGNTWFHV